MVPWLALPPCTLLGKALTDYLTAREWPLTKVRKVVQTLCFFGQNVALFCMCHTTNFTAALICMTVVIGMNKKFIRNRYLCSVFLITFSAAGGTGFHNNAVIVNPQDLAPSYSGSVFGLMNTVGAIPGKENYEVFFLNNEKFPVGFLGVYLAGHILELTQSWPAVFSTAAAINTIGWFIFVTFGSAEAIV